MLTAVVHIADIKFMHDSDTDGVYIHNEELLEIGEVWLIDENIDLFLVSYQTQARRKK